MLIYYRISFIHIYRRGDLIYVATSELSGQYVVNAGFNIGMDNARAFCETNEI